MYVYRIYNKKNGKMYIGSTNNFLIRKNEHFGALRKGVHHNAFMQRDFNKFGEAVFVFEVLIYDLKDRTTALLKEYDLILKNRAECYNIHTDCPVFDPKQKQDWSIFRKDFVPRENSKANNKKAESARIKEIKRRVAAGESFIKVNIPYFRRKK